MTGVASAGVTELGERGSWGGVWRSVRRDTRGERGYDGSGERGCDGSGERGCDGVASAGMTELFCAGVTERRRRCDEFSRVGMTEGWGVGGRGACWLGEWVRKPRGAIDWGVCDCDAFC